MKKILLFIFIISISFSFTNAQTIVLEETVNDTKPSTWGKNYRHWGHFYGNYGTIIPENNQVIAGLSNSFGLGYRYKLKLCKHYALGADLNMSFVNYRLKENVLAIPESFFVFPDSYTHKLRYKLLSFEFYQRINIGRRGNHIGNYLDLGGYGSVLFSSKYIVKFKSDYWFYSNGKTIYYNLSDFNPLNYGLSARVGINRWVIFAKYRLSNVWNETEDNIYSNSMIKYEMLKLPRLLVGIEISFF